MPRKAYTDEQRRMVEALAGYGVPNREIARVMDISRDTVEKNFVKQLAVGATKANAKVAETLFEMATRDRNVTAAIFWLKTRAGWKEPKTEVNVTMTLEEVFDEISRNAEDKPRLRVVE